MQPFDRVRCPQVIYKQRLVIGRRIFGYGYKGSPGQDDPGRNAIALAYRPISLFSSIVSANYTCGPSLFGVKYYAKMVVTAN
jgi:hypothetical protein